MKRHFAFLSFISILLACSEDSSSPLMEVSKTAGIDLQTPKVDDEATYLLYRSDCMGNFRFTGDTLEVRVIQRNDSLFLQESYTSGSSLVANSEHVLIPKDGYTLVPQRFRSQMLFFYGNDTIFLNREPTVQLVQNGCRLLQENNPFIGDAIGSVNEFRFGEVRITDKKGISCVPGFFDIEAYIFYEDHLNMVHIVQSEESNNVFGFVGIE